MIGGWSNRQFRAPFIFEGHCNTQLFESYLIKLLLPTLQPGTTLIIDNASFHKSKNRQLMLEQAQCQLLYLPPYSPDLNPIEKFWSKVKNAIKKKMRKATVTLENAMFEALNEMAIY